MVDNNTQEICQHEWQSLNGEVKMYKCNQKYTCKPPYFKGVYCYKCQIYFCEKHQPKLQTEQSIEDWFQKQGQKKIKIAQLIKFIEKNFKGQGQQFKTGQFKGDWMYPRQNNDYHIHFNTKYIGFKSTHWEVNDQVSFKKILSEYQTIRDNGQTVDKEMTPDKKRFLQFMRQLMEIIKSQQQ